MAKKKTKKQPKLASDPLLRKYKKNYLSKVLVQVQFVNPITSGETAPEDKLEQQIRRSFPETQHRPVNVQGFTLNPQDGLEKAINKRTTHYVYVAKSRNVDKYVEITDEHCIVCYSRYSSFAQLTRDFKPILRQLFESYKDIQINRLGLRYIDNIELKEGDRPTNWSKYLNQKLLSSFDIPSTPNMITRSFHVLETMQDDMQLRFQYGMRNPDYPSPIKRKIFTLDNDAYVTGALDCEAILDYLDRLHVLVKESFENAITQEFRKHLGIKA